MTFLTAGALALTGAFQTGSPDTVAPRRVVLHVAADASDDADGSEDAPLDFSLALERLERLSDGGGTAPVEVRLGPGRYRFERGFTIGSRVRGTAEAPVIIRPGEGAGSVVFDGGVDLPLDGFGPVTDPQERALLAAGVADRVVAQTVESDAMDARLASKVMLTLLADGAVCLPARFPNEGYAGLAREPLAGEVQPPAVPPGKEGYGVRAGHPPHGEPGRPDGWLGSLDEPRGARVGLASREDEMAGTWAQWEAGIARAPGRVLIDGFLDANWLQRSQPLVGADAATRTVHLSRALAYGWNWRAGDKPFRIFGLLSELDAPGEWHYDVTTRRLYLYPPRPLEELERVTVPVAKGFLRLAGCAHVHVEGLTVEHVAAGTLVHMDGGEGNVLGGSTLRSSTASGVLVGGRGNAVRGCDLVDLDRHLSLGGGRRGPGVLEAAGNVVENCHLWQRTFSHRRVGVGIRGVGNVFRHNLVHNSLGQAVTVRGNEHVIELNELFNIGFDEGDGGAIYSGGDLAGYGTVYRHNFLHHLMHVPGKVERSGIHLDDLQAGATCEGNVFFKSAGKGVFMNGGAGHRVLGNVFVLGHRGVYNVGHGAEKTFVRQEAIAADPGHDYRGKKEDYVGRVEAELGERGWAQEPWRSRHPTFFQVMEDRGRFGRLWPIRCEIRDNWFVGNARGDGTIWSRVAPEARAKSVIEGDRAAALDVFEDPDVLDLRFREGVDGAPPIPFERIGLRVDRLRPRRPDPRSYRAAIRRAFEGVPSMPGTHERFDSAAAVARSPLIEH